MGFGLFQSPNSKVILSDVSHENLGMASALLATVRNLGIVTGTALSSMLLMVYYSKHGLLIPAPSHEIFVYALKETFLTIALFCALGIPAVFLTKTKKAHHETIHQRPVH